MRTAPATNDIKVTLSTPKPIRDIALSDARIKRNQAARRAREVTKAHEKKNISIVLAIIIAAVLMFGAVIANAVIENNRINEVKAMPTEMVIVQQGDSIDGIAAAHPIDGFSAHYLGQIIADINDIDGVLQPGQRILVPVAE